MAASDAADRAKTRKRSTFASTRRSTTTRQTTAGCKDTTSDEMITRRSSLKRKRNLCGDDAEQEVSTNVARKKKRTKRYALQMGAKINLKEEEYA